MHLLFTFVFVYHLAGSLNIRKSNKICDFVDVVVQCVFGVALWP